MNDPHAATVATYSDALLDALLADCGRRNLRDYRDHETRWLAARSSAARAERKRRKTAGPPLAGATPSLVRTARPEAAACQ